MKRYVRASRTYFDLSNREGAFGNYRKEKNFEKILQDNGYTIHGYHEYYDHTAYKVEKEGIVMEVTFAKNGNPKATFLMIDDLWGMKKQQADNL